MASNEVLHVKAPAKINLFLAIGARRPDGFHDLETIFHAIELCDELSFRKTKESFRITCLAPDVPTDSSNLIWKAAELLKKEKGCSFGCEVELKKKVPMGAGLGGGSSDAAATLRALDRLWETHSTRGELERMAAKLGSDVPFFLGKGTALGKGRGEILESLPSLPELFLVVALPQVRISTPWAYARLDEMPARRHFSIAPMLEALKKGSLSEIAQSLGNSFEEALFPSLPILADLKKKLLSSGALGASLSGSGSAMFGLYENEEKAKRAADGLRAEGFTAYPLTPSLSPRCASTDG
ncbi:MAG TPA: 4-(cytidine 5'-diphospho)-2-C-methyl-D-erythritol kinase [Cyanobacteria bacterium UBA8530]|nr:4-(cytidine 5'-diphospho)-2-C-methyl-D-erythritol kinase [Cyanobacteria bacterium UBA8530]